MKYIIFISFSLFIAAGCSRFQKTTAEDKDDILLAEVSSSQLYASAIPAFNFVGLNPEDSIAFLKQYVADWIKDEIFVLRAKEVLTNMDNIESETKKYKKDLIKAAYQKKVEESFEISLTEEDLESYYKKNKEYFRFEESHYEIKYIILPKSVSNLQQIRKTISEGKNSNFLSSYCTNNQGKCHYKIGEIKDFSFLSVVLKMNGNQLEKSSNYKYHYIDEDNVMIYKIEDVKEKGSLAPLEIVKKEVSILAKHNKKEDYLLELEEKTYQKAKNDKIFENYIN